MTDAALLARAAACADALGVQVVSWRRGGEPAANTGGGCGPDDRHDLAVVCPDPVPHALIERCAGCGRVWMCDWEAGPSPVGDTSLDFVVREERARDRRRGHLRS